MKYWSSFLEDHASASRWPIPFRTSRTFASYLKALKQLCLIGFEATGNYHRPLAHYLEQNGFTLHLVSSLAIARTREALYNSWDKNDFKDCQVILQMLKTGMTQRYHDPLGQGIHEPQEIARTCYQVSLAMAILDRLLHHCRVINIKGHSYRLQGEAFSTQSLESQ